MFQGCLVLFSLFLFQNLFFRKCFFLNENKRNIFFFYLKKPNHSIIFVSKKKKKKGRWKKKKKKSNSLELQTWPVWTTFLFGFGPRQLKEAHKCLSWVCQNLHAQTLIAWSRPTISNFTDPG